MSKSDKLYKDSPSVGRGEDGKPEIKRPSKADGENMGVDGKDEEGQDAEMPVDVHQAGERREVKHRHVAEHLAMHHRQEQEHAMHGDADKKHLFKKHEEEHSSMQERHMTEIKDMHSRQAKGKKE